jgi:hypothetical protein
MTKSELLAEIAAFYDYVGTEYVVNSSDEHESPTMTYYNIIVYETGLSEKNKKPVLKSKYIGFVVYDEGGGSEAAYYIENELTNEVNKDITTTGSLSDIHKIYISDDMRGRVQAAVAKAAKSILNESYTSSLLTVDASSAQADVTVTDGSLFWVGKEVVISDTSNSEDAIIKSISSNVLTMEEDLTNSYATADGAIVTFKDNIEREQWAANALLNPDTYTLSMVDLISLDSTVQSSGGTAADSTIENIIESFINRIALISYM